MVKIAIDARESGTSTGRYIDKLIEHMHTLKPAYEIIILTKEHRLEYLRHISPGFTIVETPYKEFTFGEQLGFKKQIGSLKADLVHFGMVQQPVLYKGRVVTTMHDLTGTRFKNPEINPVVYKAKQEIYTWVNKRVARKSAAIIVPSQFVKDDVVHFTNINPDKITVTYEAADTITDKPEPNVGLTNKQFIMYIGRPTPHKNLERLIEAFKILKLQHPNLLLVLAGKKDNNYLRIEHFVNGKHITNVMFTDFVREGQLRWLYEHCAAYVFPSLSEGFGLPGLEAMLHGAPVVSSNTTSLPEIYGDAAHYFPPLDVDAIATAINDVLTDKALRDKLVIAGKLQAKKYSWTNMAQQTLEVYKQVLGEK